MRLDEALAEIERFVAREPGEAHVLLITGDLADTPDPASLEAVSDRLRGFRDRARTPVLVLPRNHDLEKYPPSPFRGRRAVERNLERFAAACAWSWDASAFPGFWTASPLPAPGAPFLRTDAFAGPRGTLHVVGVDTMVDDDLWAEGRIGRDGLAALEAALRALPVAPDDRVAVALHHSPFFDVPTMRLVDAGGFADALVRSGVRVDALFAGHVHFGQDLSGRNLSGKETPGIRFPVALEGGCLVPERQPWFKKLLFPLWERSRLPRERAVCRAFDPWAAPGERVRTLWDRA